jgi:hypothetical protein
LLPWRRPPACEAGSSRRLFAPILLLALSAALFAQSAPPAAEKSSSVAGTVVNAISGEPIPRAHVTLMSFGKEGRHDYGAITTAEGRFSITGIPAGSINAWANRLGFAADQTSAAGAELKAGDHKDDLTLKLTPTGTIAGTVLDADGEPVEHSSVMAESRYGGGPSSPTDAQGKFRIGGLAPGKYRIKATPNESPFPPEIRTDGTVESHYSETYYPSALDAAGAARVAVQAGAESGGIEIRLVRTPIVRVSGKVSGAPAGAENIQLMVNRKRDNLRGFGSMSYSSGGWSGARVKKDGTFAIWRLAPGPYRIGAQWNTPNGQMAAAAPVDVVVGDVNIDGVELRMMAWAELAGQVEYDGDAKPPAPAEGKPAARRQGPTVYLQGIDGNMGAVAGLADENGAFTLEKVMPGRYRVSWNGGQGYVRSMRLGQSEIAGSILDLSNGAAGATLAIVVSRQYGAVSGSVQADGASTAGVRVVLLPDSTDAGFGAGYQLGNIGADGSYSINNVVPGTYKLAAIAEADANALMQGGDEWDQYAPVMGTVTVAAGDKATQNLKILAR